MWPNERAKIFSGSFSDVIKRTIFSNKSKEDLKDSEKLTDVQSKVKILRLVEKTGRQGFHCHTRERFELVTKAVTDTSEKKLEETKSNTKAIEELDESNI